MARIPLETILSRAGSLRCPRCGEGRLFRGWFRMHERCEGCDLKYERAPGYFLGSIYINYGVTTLAMTFAYIFFHFVLKYENRYVLPPLIGFCLLFPAIFLRYARSFWLGLDCYFDTEGFELNEPQSAEQTAPPAEDTSPAP